MHMCMFIFPAMQSESILVISVHKRINHAYASYTFPEKLLQL